MAIESLSILVATGEGKAYLAQEYGKVVENVNKGCIANLFKNRELSGTPGAGAYVARRFANVEVKDIDATKVMGDPSSVKADDVIVAINIDKQAVEAVAEKDVRLYGVENFVERRLNNHQVRLIKTLEKAFWAEGTKGRALYSSSSDKAEQIDAMIVALEETKTQFVDGVDRENMGLILSPTYYTALQNKIDTLPGVGGGTYQFFHNVRVFSSTDLPTGVNAVLVREEAIAEPYYINPDNAGQYPGSEFYHFGLFLHAGAKLCSPELAIVLSTAALAVSAETQSIVKGATGADITITNYHGKLSAKAYDSTGATEQTTGWTLTITGNKLAINPASTVTAGTYKVKVFDETENGSPAVVTVTVTNS